VQSLHGCDFSMKGPFSTSTRYLAFPSMLPSQHTLIFFCFTMSVTFVLLKQASPFPICVQKSVSKLVCTSTFSLRIKLLEFRRFSSTCLDSYQHMTGVIANAHFPKINHIWNQFQTGTSGFKTFIPPSCLPWLLLLTLCVQVLNMLR